jgi:predicted kinase
LRTSRGRLGTGKSSLAAPLAAELGYSLVTKDLIKETLHAPFVPGDGEIDQVLVAAALRCVV